MTIHDIGVNWLFPTTIWASWYSLCPYLIWHIPFEAINKIVNVLYHSSYYKSSHFLKNKLDIIILIIKIKKKGIK